MVNKEITTSVLLVSYRNHRVERLCESKEGGQYGEIFRLIPNLNLNSKTPGGTPHECSVCGKVFVCHSSLNIHMRCHTGHKPYEYQTYGEKPYMCKECGKAFSYRKFCENHKRSHNGGEKYKCKECGKAFRFLPAFIKREKIHTGGKPRECKECGKACMCTTTLQTHRGMFLISVRYVVKFLVVPLHCEHMEQFTLLRNPLSVNNVEESLDVVKAYIHI